jgi:hypothetical protein
MTHSRHYPLICLILAVGTTAALPGSAFAIPQFARQYNLRCVACHTVPPMLNASGQDFLQRGYRPSAESDLTMLETAPVALWITARQEDQLDRNFGEGYLNRVELISGGPISIPGYIEEAFSYFLEWRPVSLESRSNGRLRDRSGRFEDAFINWQVTESFQITAGQFRSLSQIDVSRRLGLSEPAIFSASLPGEPAASARITGLRAFAPSARSPGFMFLYHSLQGESEADGLFHSVVLPFVGEWSLPITPEAHQEASFVSQGPPKGAFLETYWRHDLSSIGGHVFVDDDRWLLTMVGTLNHAASPWTRDFYVTGALGWDDTNRTASRTRSSIEVVYIPTLADDWLVRAGVGFRAERITGPGTFPAYIPYFVLSSPNESYTILVQVEYRHQENNRSFFLDLSLVF